MGQSQGPGISQQHPHGIDRGMLRSIVLRGPCKQPVTEMPPKHLLASLTNEGASRHPDHWSGEDL